jgi:hypothetical protein
MAAMVTTKYLFDLEIGSLADIKNDQAWQECSGGYT